MGVRRPLAALVVVCGLTAAGCSTDGTTSDVAVLGAWTLVSGSTADGPLAITTHTQR